MELLNLVNVVEVLKTKDFFTQLIKIEESFTFHYHTLRMSIFLDKCRGKVEKRGLLKCMK